MTVLTGGIPSTNPYSDPSIIVTPMSEHDGARGRRRDRSMNRGAVRGLRNAPADESSTLRGRSRRRATSPAFGYAAGTASPRVLSPNRRRLLQARLRREHCPSRVASPAATVTQRAVHRRHRSPSRSRSPTMNTEQDNARLYEASSRLRNEFLAPDDARERTSQEV